MRRIILWSLLFVSCTGLGAQGIPIYVPDSDATAGTCNVIPFGQSTSFSAGYSYVSRIPASFMDPTLVRVEDIGFAPCTSGSWTCNDVLIGVGHLPATFPVPFSYPTQAGGTGSFVDFTVLYDSTIQGPLTWNVTINQWSYLGLNGGPTGAGFQWDLLSDVGFFVTYNASTVTGFSGSFHRSATEERAWSTGYFPLTSMSNDLAALKISFTLTTGLSGVAFQVNQPGASADIDAVLGSATTLAMPGLMVAQTGTLALSSTASMTPWDLAYGLAAVVPGGSITYGDGQIFNLDVTDPTLSFLFGFFQGPGFVNTNLPINILTPIGISVQMGVIDPSSPIGFWLSQPSRLTVM